MADPDFIYALENENIRKPMKPVITHRIKVSLLGRGIEVEDIDFFPLSKRKRKREEKRKKKGGKKGTK